MNANVLGGSVDSTPAPCGVSFRLKLASGGAHGHIAGSAAELAGRLAGNGEAAHADAIRVRPGAHTRGDGSGHAGWNGGCSVRGEVNGLCL